jgi:hypothetical protein
MANTVLSMVQDILSSMDSYEVNSISDNTESMQVATLLSRVYDAITASSDYREHKSLFEMEASNDPAKPVLMYRPSKVRSVSWIKYNSETITDQNDNYRLIEYLEPLDYINYMQGLSEDDADVLKFVHMHDGDSLDLMCYTNRSPLRYTTFDNYTFIFDAYDKEVDGTLQKTKTMCYGTIIATPFELRDDFVPDLAPEQMVYLYQEAKAQAWADMKQTANARAEKAAREQKIHLQHHFDNPVRSPNYGR